jgi:hypothetical protein
VEQYAALSIPAKTTTVSGTVLLNGVATSDTTTLTLVSTSLTNTYTVLRSNACGTIYNNRLGQTFPTSSTPSVAFNVRNANVWGVGDLVFLYVLARFSGGLTYVRTGSSPATVSGVDFAWEWNLSDTVRQLSPPEYSCDLKTYTFSPFGIAAWRTNGQNVFGLASGEFINWQNASPPQASASFV